MVGRTQNATTAREEVAEFNHKACVCLAERGNSRAEIAEVMGLSPRTVRRFLSSPCPTYEAEKREVQERREYEEWQRTARGRVPFVREGDFLSETELRVRALRDRIEELAGEGVSKAGIARHLQVSRSTVHRYARCFGRAA